MGLNNHGQLGNGDPAIQQQSTPMLVESLELSLTKQICCSKASTFAVLDNGDLYSWGSGKNGCLGIGSEADQFTPCKVDLPEMEADEEPQ
jgi:alpha-tubulin suppressor-like RCC1 family protein